MRFVVVKCGWNLKDLDGYFGSLGAWRFTGSLNFTSLIQLLVPTNPTQLLLAVYKLSTSCLQAVYKLSCGWRYRSQDEDPQSASWQICLASTRSSTRQLTIAAVVPAWWSPLVRISFALLSRDSSRSIRIVFNLGSFTMNFRTLFILGGLLSCTLAQTLTLSACHEHDGRE